jgi:hypothetical protein
MPKPYLFTKPWLMIRGPIKPDSSIKTPKKTTARVRSGTVAWGIIEGFCLGLVATELPTTQYHEGSTADEGCTGQAD